MSKTLTVTFLIASVLFAALLAQAKGPKTTIIVQSDSGVTSASVDVTLCDTTDCSSGFDICPNTTVNAPNTTVTTSCGRPGRFKVEAYEFAINVNQNSLTDCGGVALKDTPTVCTANGGTITLSLK
jgi:hypothetical protein